MQAAGANATTKHIEELSLCGMFLMEASRKADKAFNVPPPTTHHTIRNATEDILTMIRATEETDRRGSPFIDPSTKGMEDKWPKNGLREFCIITA